MNPPNLPEKDRNKKQDRPLHEPLSVSEAKRLMNACCRPVTHTQMVTLADASGRICAADVCSALSLPEKASAAMDGYAFSSVSLATEKTLRLKVAGRSLAGHPYPGQIAAGECALVMTGALMPDGCDTVIMQENVSLDENGLVTFDASGVAPGENVRAIGENLRAGDTVLKTGDVINSAHVGLLAQIGVNKIKVYGRIRVALFSTGDELVEVGTTMDPGQIVDSNRPTLASLLRQMGCEVVDMGIVGDDADALQKAIARACLQADAIITSGGVSVGIADYTKDVMAKLGTIVFWSINMRPGRPLAFGRVGKAENEAMLFGLPGNPVAAMVSFIFLVRDALLVMMGRNPQPPVLFNAVAREDLAKKKGRTEFQRGLLEADESGRIGVRLTGSQGSGILDSMARASCIICLEENRGKVAKGETVSVLPLTGLI